MNGFHLFNELGFWISSIGYQLVGTLSFGLNAWKRLKALIFDWVNKWLLCVELGFCAFHELGFWISSIVYQLIGTFSFDIICFLLKCLTPFIFAFGFLPPSDAGPRGYPKGRFLNEV